MYWNKSTVIERVRNIRKRISISSSFIVIETIILDFWCWQLSISFPQLIFKFFFFVTEE